VLTEVVDQYIEEEFGPGLLDQGLRTWTATVLVAALYAGRRASGSFRRQRRAVSSMSRQTWRSASGTRRPSAALPTSTQGDRPLLRRSTVRPKLAARMTEESKATTDAFARQAVESAVVAPIDVEERVEEAVA
jgi:hypothetical protein